MSTYGSAAAWQRSNSAATRVVVVQVAGRSIGLQIDAVSEGIELPAAAIVSAVGQVRGAQSATLLLGVARVEDRLILLLDLARVVDTTCEEAFLPAPPKRPHG